MEVMGISNSTPVMPSQPTLELAQESRRQEVAPPRAAPPEPKDEKKTSQLDPAATERLVEALQKYLSSLNIGLTFKVHDGTGAVMVSVVNVDTGEVIRQIPPEQMLNAIAKLNELVGTLLDTTT